MTVMAWSSEITVLLESIHAYGNACVTIAMIPAVACWVCVPDEPRAIGML